MSHLKEYQGNTKGPDDRNLGDEWLDWNGRNETTIIEGQGLFITFAAAVIIVTVAALFLITFMITPRLALWGGWLPKAVWITAIAFSIVAVVWFLLLSATVFSGRRMLPSRTRQGLLFGLIFSGVFRAAAIFGISRDRIGHSFVQVSNSISKAFKKKGGVEKVLLLLPRCLAKEELEQINKLKEIYPIHIHTVSGGELARKKVKELKPTAVIGVACERDLVSGIRDVGNRLSVIGLPNRRPNGPCKSTHVDMDKLISTIEFYLGPPASA